MARKKRLACLPRDSRLAKSSLSLGSTNLTAVAISNQYRGCSGSRLFLRASTLKKSVHSQTQSAQKLDVAFHKIETAEGLCRLPAHLVEYQVDWLALEFGDAEKKEPDGIAARIGVLVVRDLRAGGAPDSQFLFQFAVEGLGGRFALFHFAAGKLPLERVRLVRLAPPDQDLAFALNDRRYHLDHGIIGTYPSVFRTPARSFSESAQRDRKRVAEEK